MGRAATSLPEKCQRNGNDAIDGLCQRVDHQLKCTGRWRDGHRPPVAQPKDAFDGATAITWSHVMKTTLFLCSSLALSIAFAADFPTGTFEGKQTPFTVSFDDNGQFRVKQGDTLEVKGSYSATASELKLTDAEGPWACTKAGEQTGTYTWKYENAVLTFIKLTDKCDDRVKSLVGPAWQRQK
jgi:hypothetical protein